MIAAVQAAWQWLAKNSSALRGVAAIAVIVSSLVVVPTYLSRTLRPDIILRISESERVSVPPGVVDWTRQIVEALRALPEANEKTREGRTLLGLKIQGEVGGLAGYLRTTLEIVNQSDRTIAGVRIHLKPFHGLQPTYDLSSTFLAAAERDRYLSQLRSLTLTIGQDALLPELPPLPPGGVATLYVYDGIIGDLAVSAPGATSRVIRRATVDRTWLIDWYLYPNKGGLLIGFVVVSVVIALIVTGRRGRRRAS